MIKDLFRYNVTTAEPSLLGVELGALDKHKTYLFVFLVLNKCNLNSYRKHYGHFVECMFSWLGI